MAGELRSRTHDRLIVELLRFQKAQKRLEKLIKRDFAIGTAVVVQFFGRDVFQISGKTTHYCMPIDHSVGVGLENLDSATEEKLKPWALTRYPGQYSFEWSRILPAVDTVSREEWLKSLGVKR